MRGTYNPSIGNNFFEHGIEEIAAHYAMQEQREKPGSHAITRQTRGPGIVRHRIGSMVMSLSILIAGTTVHIKAVLEKTVRQSRGLPRIIVGRTPKGAGRFRRNQGAAFAQCRRHCP
jgi:hypothetical protein